MKLSLIKKIIFALFLGLSFTIYLIQNQDDFKLNIKKEITRLAKETLGCDITFEMAAVNLFLPKITLKNILMKPCDKELENSDWHWRSETLELECFWLDYILHGKFKATLKIDHFDGYSLVEKNNLSISPHIKKLLFAGGNFPMSITSIKLNKSFFNIYDSQSGCKINLGLNYELKFLKDALKMSIYLTSGNILKKDLLYCDNLEGLFQIDVFQGNISKVSLNGLCNLPFLISGNDKCFFAGKWEEDTKQFKLGTIDGKLLIDSSGKSSQAVNLNSGLDVEAKICAPIAYIQKLFSFYTHLKIEGDCVLSLKTCIKEQKNFADELSGSCEIKNLNPACFPLLICDKLKIDFVKDNKTAKGTVFLDKKNMVKLAGNWSWNEDSGLGNIQLKNDSDTILYKERMVVNSGDLNLDASISKSKSNGFDINSNYEIAILDLKTESKFKASGQISYSDHVLKSMGYFESMQYVLDCNLKSGIFIKKFFVSNRSESNEHVECINAKSIPGSSNRVVISAQYQHIKNQISKILGMDLRGEGILKLEGEFKRTGFEGNLILRDGNIIIPKTYNIIKDISGLISIDFASGKIVINNFIIKLFKGSLECQRAIIIMDESFNISPKFIHFPCLIRDCSFNLKDDISAGFSGKLLLQKIASDYNLKGYVIIDQAQIKNNLFSGEFRKKVLGSGSYTFENNITNDSYDNFKFNISIISKNPVRIKTPFFDTQAQINLVVSKNSLNPEVTGSVELIGGAIKFPYKHLNIMSGSLYFLQNQPYDPIITLMAKNKVRGFVITIHVTGSAQNQSITFESSPPLTEEQIGALLLVGSENASMNIIVPALIVQNIKNIIWGSTQTHNKIQKYFNSLLKPFKHIRFVPAFSDETGRGGFKASIEVDVNDRLHASLQKNFSLSEDTKFEIDYLVTDEISLRAMKDERSDLGAEIEMRWKF